jgi:hypothetical protein
MIREICSPLPNTKAFVVDKCSVIVSREDVKERGVLVPRWHMSISRADRYPSWGEIKRARYELIPHDVTMAMLLPPPDQFVNVHPNCFHLWEIETET